MPILLIVLLLPLVEIALFILLGSRIGVAPVLVLTILSLVLGVLVLRAHQARAAAMMQGGLRNVAPGTFLAQGAFATLGGMLLILPGFLTDTLGLLLLFPPLQRLIMRAVAARIDVQTVHMRREGDIIEGEYRPHPTPDSPYPDAAQDARRIAPPRDTDQTDGRH